MTLIIMRQIGNICIRRSLKIVAQNAPLVSRDDTTPVRHIQKTINSVLYVQLVTLSGRVLNTFTTRVNDVYMSLVCKSNIGHVR